LSEQLNKGQIRSQVEVYLMNTSIDVNSLSWSVADLDGYINEAALYTQQVTGWFEDFENIVCTASVSTYTGSPHVYQYERLTWDRNFLPQTNEYELDRDDPSWRLAAPNVSPYRFYYPQMGQQFQIVPYPTPAQNGVSYQVQPAQSALAVDTFTRANENPLNPANWTLSASSGHGLKIIGNTCQASVAGAILCGELYTGIVWPNDQWGQVTASVLSTSESQPLVLFLRGTPGVLNTAYAMILSTSGSISTIGMIKVVGAVSTALAPAVPVVFSNGDIFKFTVVGSQLTAYQNGVAVLAASDSSIASGSPGLSIKANPLTDVQLINFSAGSFVGEFGVVAQFLNADGFTVDTSYTFSQEFGIVIGVTDTNGAIIMFRPDNVADPFVATNGTYASSPDLGELQIYSTDELNIGTAFTRIPDTMVLDTDVPQLPANSHFALVFYALMKCFVREGEFQDLQEATAWFEAYGDWMESVLENKARRWPTRVKSMEPFESGSLFAKRMNAIGYPMQLDLQPSYGP
jgi:hypothetical protein